MSTTPALAPAVTTPSFPLLPAFQEIWTRGDLGSPALLTAIMEQSMALREPLNDSTREEAERNLSHLILLHGALDVASEAAAEELADLITGKVQLRYLPMRQGALVNVRYALDAIIEEQPAMARSMIGQHLEDLEESIYHLYPPTPERGNSPFSIAQVPSGVVNDIDQGRMISWNIQDRFAIFPRQLLMATLATLNNLMFTMEDDEDDWVQDHSYSRIEELEDPALHDMITEMGELEAKGRDNVLLDAIEEHLPTVTSSQLRRLAAMVEEYNPEWALASFNWME